MFSSLTFALYLLLPALGWSCWRGRRKLHPVMFLLLLYAAGYSLYVGGVWLVGWKLERDLYAYDLDGDREFSAAELTPAAREAMRAWATDTGRLYAPFVAVPATLAWVGLNLGAFTAGRWLFHQFRRNPAAT